MESSFGLKAINEDFFEGLDAKIVPQPVKRSHKQQAPTATQTPADHPPAGG